RRSGRRREHRAVTRMSLNGETRGAKAPLFLSPRRVFAGTGGNPGMLLPNGGGKGDFSPCNGPCARRPRPPDSGQARRGLRTATKERRMNKTISAFVFGLALAGAAQAQTVVTDTDGNGSFSIEELTAAYPDMTPALFAQVDVNGDGSVDADEL